MNENTIRELLQAVGRGDVDADQALEKLRHLPFEATDFATIDHHRALRCGFAEVIFCPGKTPDQAATIFGRLAEAGGNVLATRAEQATADAIRGVCAQADYNELARTVVLRQGDQGNPVGHVAIVAAGTSDLPVAEEARITAELMGAMVTTHYDVGVAGLHRLLACREDLTTANAIVVTAGMEGALASVVGGLVGVPVLAVPTSVGYGASFGGLAALLAMLNSCASNVCTVNIDNGFAGGYISAMINRQSAGPGEA